MLIKDKGLKINRKKVMDLLIPYLAKKFDDTIV